MNLISMHVRRQGTHRGEWMESYYVPQVPEVGDVIIINRKDFTVVKLEWEFDTKGSGEDLNRSFCYVSVREGNT